MARRSLIRSANIIKRVDGLVSVVRLLVAAGAASHLGSGRGLYALIPGAVLGTESFDRAANLAGW